MIIDKITALDNLVPDANFEIIDGDTIISHKGKTVPSDAEIDAELKRLQAEYEVQAYSRNRKTEYPDWGTQLEKIYDDGLTKWKSEMVDPVKAKWPKDNSGPV